MADDGKQPKPNCCQRFGNGLSNFGNFLYNRESGQVMGRSGESWLKIGVFYLIFYGFLAAFFSAMLTVFLSTLNDPGIGADKGPKLTQFLKNKPGLTFVAPGAIVWADYGADNTTHWNRSKDALESYTQDLQKNLLSKYSGKACEDGKGRIDANGGYIDCTFDAKKHLGVCGDNTTAVSKADNTVCIYVKINKVFKWIPTGSAGGNYLKLKCGTPLPNGVELLPAGGFHLGSFPFLGEKNFELPVVALKINTEKYDGSLINCKLDKDGTDIEVSDSSVAHRAFGQVDIELKKLTPDE